MAGHTQAPRVINVDKNAAYPNAIETLKNEKTLSQMVELQQNKYLNNVVEQDHRNIKRRSEANDGVQVVQHGKTHIKRH